MFLTARYVFCLTIQLRIATLDLYFAAAALYTNALLTTPYVLLAKISNHYATGTTKDILRVMLSPNINLKINLQSAN